MTMTIRMMITRIQDNNNNPDTPSDDNKNDDDSNNDFENPSEEGE